MPVLEPEYTVMGIDVRTDNRIAVVTFDYKNLVPSTWSFTFKSLGALERLVSDDDPFSPPSRE